MQHYSFLIFLIFFKLNLYSQFAPPAGQLGTTAIHCDSNIIIDWSKNCKIIRGLQDISDTTLGYASVGDSSFALGKADNYVVSLGDGGSAILEFEPPIENKNGFDFAVFENSFSDTFLELAFVEVSSDGINFFRFPSTSLTQDTSQIDSWGHLDATKINNLAGKYRAKYGTPFDLEELINITNLNINAITHIKIIDVVGSILPQFASFDQNNNIINDPWNTPFPSSGFDLDAIAVIDNHINNVEDKSIELNFNIYPNPAYNKLFIESLSIDKFYITITDILGKTYYSNIFINKDNEIDISKFQNGIYFCNIFSSNQHISKKIIIFNE